MIPSRQANIERDDIERLTYLDQCINESLRLFPPVATIGRKLDRPVTFKNVEVPAGIQVMVAIRQLHRKEEYWGKDCNEFNPDHFRPGNISETMPFSFIPFSAGPRNCIGMGMELYFMIFFIIFHEVFFFVD